MIYDLPSADSTAFVFPEFRKQGIYSSLEEAMQKHFSQFPEIKTFKVYVLAANAGARAVYDKSGFVTTELILEKKVQ